MSTDTPRPERVTLTDDEREAVADAFSHATEVNCWRSTCDEALWTTVARIAAAREDAREAAVRAQIKAAEETIERVRALTNWTSVDRDTNGVDRLVPASEILAALDAARIIGGEGQ